VVVLQGFNTLQCLQQKGFREEAFFVWSDAAGVCGRWQA
jgi:hypothetical protein